jgi:hypothetical protein
VLPIAIGALIGASGGGLYLKNASKPSELPGQARAAMTARRGVDLLAQGIMSYTFIWLVRALMRASFLEAATDSKFRWRHLDRDGVRGEVTTMMDDGALRLTSWLHWRPGPAGEIVVTDRLLSLEVPGLPAPVQRAADELAEHDRGLNIDLSRRRERLYGLFYLGAALQSGPDQSAEKPVPPPLQEFFVNYAMDLTLAERAPEYAPFEKLLFWPAVQTEDREEGGAWLRAPATGALENGIYFGDCRPREPQTFSLHLADTSTPDPASWVLRVRGLHLDDRWLGHLDADRDAITRAVKREIQSSDALLYFDDRGMYLGWLPTD